MIPHHQGQAHPALTDYDIDFRTEAWCVCGEESRLRAGIAKSCFWLVKEVVDQICRIEPGRFICWSVGKRR